MSNFSYQMVDPLTWQVRVDMPLSDSERDIVHQALSDTLDAIQKRLQSALDARGGRDAFKGPMVDIAYMRSTSSRHDLIIELVAWQCQALASDDAPHGSPSVEWELSARVALADAITLLNAPSSAAEPAWAARALELAAEREALRARCVAALDRLPDCGYATSIRWIEETRALFGRIATALFAELRTPRT